jgi:hypothetical protein
MVGLAEVRVRCEQHGNVVAIGPTALEAPVVVLYERSASASGFDLPSLALWRDGTVVYSEANETGQHVAGLFQARLSPEAAFELVARSLSRLRDAPIETAISPNMTDQPTVEVIVRDGDSWRRIGAYGLTRETRGDEVPRDMRPAYVTYHELLARIPTGRTPAPAIDARPDRWPKSLASYRGQSVIDHVVFCPHEAM